MLRKIVKRCWLAFGVATLAITACHTPTPSATATVKVAYDKNDYKSLLWEISGKGIKKPSYLYGTIHMIPKSDFFLTETTKEKLANSKRLTLEIDMDNMFGMLGAMKGMFLPKGQTLKDFYTPEEYTRLGVAFKKNGMDIESLQKMKPILISSMLTEKVGKAEKDEIVAYETELMKLAKAQGKSVSGLETASYQMSVLDSIPLKEQAKMLLDAIDGEAESGVSQFEKMVAIYKTQDIQALYAYIGEESADMKNFESALLDTRNRNWIPVIEKMAKEKPTFFAVGAGHLGGKKGLIALLRAQGYDVRPLRDNP